MSDASKPHGRAAAALPLHRVRFVDWSPSAITALAFSPVPVAGSGMAPSLGATRSVLAVGRDNGNIDLCTWCEDTRAGSKSMARGWMPEMVRVNLLTQTLLGDVQYKIESLAFTVSHTHQGAPYLRLFSTSGGSIVSEHFLPASIARICEDGPATLALEEHQAPTRTLSSQGGAIWSMAASPTGKYLAIGCEDGIVRLINVAGDSFEHVTASRGTMEKVAVQSRMSRVASRILSLAWGPPKRVTKPQRQDQDSSSSDDDDEDLWQDTFLLGGLGNSTAAVWDVATGQLRSRLTMLKNRQEHTIVWSVTVLRDGTLVTGDSTGRVTFFDARTRVPIPGATFQCHTAGADVLSLCVSSDAKAVYSAGVDQKVVEYSLVGTTWTHTGTRRLHAHDVRALAMDPPLNMCMPASASRVPILVSGGLDYHLVLTPASHATWRKSSDTNPVSSSASTSFADTIQRRIAFVPASARDGVVCVASGPRWIVLRRDRSVGIWQIEQGGAWRKVLEMQMQVRSNIGAAAISHDGHFLAISDLYETKLYNLKDGPKLVKGLGVAMYKRPVSVPGASSLLFTPDGTRLILCTRQGAFVHVIQLPVHDDVPLKLLKSFEQHRTRRSAMDGRVLAGQARSDTDTTPLADASSSSHVTRDAYAPVVLAAISPDSQWLLTGDASRRLHVFHLDTLSHQRALATPACLPSSACFHPTQPSLLVITLPTNQVSFYDLDADQEPAWENSLRQELDHQLGRIREPVVGSTWLPSPAGATLVLHGPTWLCTARQSESKAASRKKRRNAGDEPEEAGAWTVRTTFKYQPLLHVGALTATGTTAELLVVERPYFSLAQSLPPAFYRGAKYGT